MKRLPLRMLPGTFAICRLDASSAIPDWTPNAGFLNLTRTADELSIVCLQSLVPPGVTCEPDWRCFQLEGPIPFTEVGVLESLLRPLAAAGIGVFVVSTFDTDYVLVKESDETAAKDVGMAMGYEIR